MSTARDADLAWRYPRKAPRPRLPLPADGRWLDVDEAARMLGISEATTYRRVREGVLVGDVACGRTVVAANSVTALRARLDRGEEPRDRRRLRGSDRKPNSWGDRFSDAYVAREG